MSKSSTSDYSGSEWDPIAQEDSVRAKDRQRAAVCCVAVYQEVEVAKSLFAKYNDLNFGKVILAPGLTKQRPRILVATAYDFCNNDNVHTTYVAFKGSSALETLFDVADSKLQCPGQDGSPIPMKGHIHNGFHKALMEELPGPMELMGFCASIVPGTQMNRLIFCGHGLGGALSHVAMLSLLFSLFGHNTEEARKSDNTLLSIAFGAPFFLDEDARDYFSATGVVPVENRFLTYINDEDPVPLMLNKLVAYPAQPTLHKKLNLKFQTILEVAGKVPYLVDTTDKLQKSASRRMPFKLPPVLKQLEETDADMTKLKTIQWQRGRGYAAFGQFTRLSGRYQIPVARSDFDAWTLSWTADSVKYHAMGHYAWNVLVDQLSQVPVPNFAEGSPPKVDEAFLTIISSQPHGDVNGARLELVGYNLGLCLRKKCAVSEFADRWEITRVEQNSIVLRNKTKLTATEISVLANQMTKVKVETMFGVTDWIQVRRKASGSGSHVIDGLKHVIGKLVIFDSVQDTGPGSPSPQSLQKLKKHLDTVAALSQSEIPLKKFFQNLEHRTRPVFEKRKDADSFIEHVSNHLQQSTLKVKLDPFIGSGEKRQLFVRRGLGGFGMLSVGIGISVYVALAIIVSAATMGIAIPIAAGGLAIGAAALVLSYRREIKLEDYDHVVKFLYATLNPGQAVLPGDKSVADYEGAIIGKVKSLISRHPTAWITQLQHDLRHQIKQTRETVINCITLMLEIDKAVEAAKEQKVLAVVGPENVGKSTLINILRNGAPIDRKDEEEEEDEDESEEADSATTGFTTHTDDPKGYLAAAIGNLVAVDFPGMGAAHDRASLSTMWEAFERLPDLCLVVMKFNGDVTADCSDVPKQVRKKLCDKVVLMVNHVDGIMKGRKTAKIWKQYPPAKMDELRQAFLRNSDNMLDSVMLTSLSTDLHDCEKDMLKDRGILFAQDALDQIRRLVYKSDKSIS